MNTTSSTTGDYTTLTPPALLIPEHQQRLAQRLKEKGILLYTTVTHGWSHPVAPTQATSVATVGFYQEVTKTGLGRCLNCNNETKYLNPSTGAEGNWIGKDGLTHVYYNHRGTYETEFRLFAQEVQETVELLQRILHGKV